MQGPDAGSTCWARVCTCANQGWYACGRACRHDACRVLQAACVEPAAHCRRVGGCLLLSFRRQLASRIAGARGLLGNCRVGMHPQLTWQHTCWERTGACMYCKTAFAEHADAPCVLQVGMHARARWQAASDKHPGCSMHACGWACHAEQQSGMHPARRLLTQLHAGRRRCICMHARTRWQAEYAERAGCRIHAGRRV